MDLSWKVNNFMNDLSSNSKDFIFYLSCKYMMNDLQMISCITNIINRMIL